MSSRPAARIALALLAACGALTAQAAGGHHAVDDAAILPRGECEQESWYGRAQGGEQLLHAGVNCGAGPVELGGAGEHTRGGDTSATSWNVEVKWAREVADGLGVGLDLQPLWATRQRPRYAATRVAALATWNLTPALALHANAGHDFVRGDRDLPNGGIAAEWSPIARWSFVLERFLDTRTHFARTGARWAAGRKWTMDLSYARRLAGPAPSFWTLGVTIGLGND